MMVKRKAIVGLVIMALAALVGCKSTEPAPTIGLNEVNFTIFPHVLVRDGKYYLKYQVSTSDEANKVRITIGQFEKPDKLYFYIVGKTSFAEYNHPVEKPIDVTGIERYVSDDAIYWVNPDRSEVQLKIERK